MVRRTIWTFFVLMTITGLSQAPRAQEPVVSLRLGDSPYEIVRPARWLQGPVTGPTVVSSWVASDHFLYPLMQVTLEELPTPGEAGVNQLLANLPRLLPGYKLIEGEWVEIGGIRVHRSVAVWTSIFGELKATRLLVPWKDKAYAVTFADLARDFAGNASLYDKCIRSLAPFEEVDTPKVFQTPPKGERPPKR